MSFKFVKEGRPGVCWHVMHIHYLQLEVDEVIDIYINICESNIYVLIVYGYVTIMPEVKSFNPWRVYYLYIG